jgi:hypothetical protein
MKILMSSISSDASDKAKKLNLKHVGFGRYADKTGKVTHVSKGGELVKLKHPQERKLSPPKKIKHRTLGPAEKSTKPDAPKPKTITQRNKSFYRITHDPQLNEMIPTGETLEKHKDSIINDTAARAHKQWASDYKKANGKDATRIKKTKDAAWIKKHGKSEVDIANTAFEDLPSDWKQENLEGAKATYAALHKVYADNTSHRGHPQAKDLDKAASDVHDSWLERNGEWAPENQKKPFDKLSEEEQDKDRAFVDSALRAYARHAHSTYIGSGNYEGDR